MMGMWRERPTADRERRDHGDAVGHGHGHGHVGGRQELPVGEEEVGAGMSRQTQSL